MARNDLLEGAQVGNQIGTSIANLILRSREQDRQKKMDDMTLQVEAQRMALMKSQQDRFEALSKKLDVQSDSADQYDHYYKMMDRYSGDMATAQQAVEAAQKSGDPNAIYEANRKLWVVQNVGEQMQKTYKDAKPQMKTITKVMPDGSKESYQVPFDPNEDKVKEQTQNLYQDTAQQLFPGVEDNPATDAQGNPVEGSTAKIAQNPQFMKAVQKSPQFQAALAKIQNANQSGFSFRNPPMPQADAGGAAPAADSSSTIQPTAQPSAQAQPQPQPQSQPAGLAPMDQQALQWANANPEDPRAATIKKKLGVQ